MSTQQEKKEQPKTVELFSDDDARDLIQSVLYDFQDAKPEALVKVFSILESETNDSQTRDRLSLLMEACFDRSDAHASAFNQYVKDCRANPTTWDLAEANPRRVQQTPTPEKPAETENKGESS